jgi:YbgC/YbaW family acyl-CoA thioester hydrolase
MFYKRRIFGFECDIYGHLNNANYLHIYEEARALALDEMNFSIHKLNDMNIQIYLIHIELSFVKAVKLEETVTIETTMEKANRLKATWKQIIRNSRDEICNEAIVKGVFIKDGKPYRLPRELYQEMEDSLKKENL